MNEVEMFNGDSLREFRKRHGLTQVKLAKLLSINRTYLAQLETGKKVPSVRLQGDIKEAVARYAAEHRPELEQGRMGANVIRDHAYGLRARIREVPVVSWAAAGEAKDYGDLASQIDETVGTHVTDPNAFAVILEGDSMEPEFKAGDRVVVAPNVEARTGDAVLVKLMDGRVYFKWFHRTGPEGKAIRLTSENPQYGPLEFNGEQVRFVYPMLEMKRMRRGR
jgi:phage repressor protein C with HTH and peptisase S24 domain